MPYDSTMPVLNSRTDQKQGHRRQVKFHWKAQIRTEVCQDNTAFMANFPRDHSTKAGQGTQGDNQCTALSSIC